MKFIFILIFLFVVNPLSAQDTKGSAAFEASVQRHYPLPKEGRWYFSMTPDSLVPVSVGYDTIIFCPTEFNLPYFLALNGSKYVMFNYGLVEQSRGDYKNHLMHDNDLYIRRKVDWLVVDLLTNTSTNLFLDSLKKVDHVLYTFKNGKMGIKEYETEIAPIYDRIARFIDPIEKYPKDLYLILNKGKYGLIDQSGEIVLPPVASIIQHELYGILKYKEGTWKYILSDGTKVDSQGKEVHFLSNNLYKIYNESRTKAVLYNKGYPVKRTAKYDDVFSDGINFIVRKDDKIGMISDDYSLLKAPFCDQIEVLPQTVTDFYTGGRFFYKYLVDDKWGLMTEGGRIFLSANYSNILESFSSKDGDRMKIVKNGKIGVISKTGAEIVKPIYDNVRYSSKGYVVEANKRLGFLNGEGEPVLKVVYSGYNIATNIFDSKNNLTVFAKGQKYHFINSNNEVFEIPPCEDYSLGNNVLKCYYNDRIEVHFLEGGRITETTRYAQVRSVNLKSVKHVGIHLTGFDVTTLELNQLTGLYGMRYQLKEGIAESPRFPYIQYSIFPGWFDAGELADSSYVFQVSNFPKLNAYRVFNWMCQDVGELYPELVLSSGIFENKEGLNSSADKFILNAQKDMGWVSQTNKDPFDAWVNARGLLYNDEIGLNHQKVYAGGDIEVVPVEESDLSMIEYFNYLNVSRNLWFTDLEVAKNVMNPTLGVKFVNGKVAVRDKRSNSFLRKPFKYEVDAFVDHNGYYSFKKKGQTTWNLCSDIETKDQFIEGLISFQVSGNDYPITFILEKSVKGQIRKAIYKMNLEQVTPFEYDDIVPAGYLGFLVRKGQNYSYINPDTF